MFEATHALALQLVRDGRRRRAADRPPGRARRSRGLLRSACATAAPQHVWVEKILDPGEHLRDWPVDGTVGYEFLNDAAALFVDPAGEAPLTDLWVEISGDDRRFGEYAFEAKLEQARTAFAPEVARLVREAPARVTGLERALASFPVYRTYVEPWSGRVEDEDRHAIAEAGLPSSLARVLQLETPGWDAFVTRFQQTTPPVMAKGVEDTAFYRYARLLALNDVGGDPARFSLSVDDFHAANRERAERFPNNLLVTQTHDTKRSGDVRARLGALAGMADEFAVHVRRWLDRQPLADLRRRAHAGRAVLHLPDAARRLADLRGAARGLPREGDARGQAAHELDRARRAPRGRGAVVREARCSRTASSCATSSPSSAAWPRPATAAALGQLLLKLTVPGIPDIYQGDELLSLSLVDPDNRRPVDWEERRAALADPPPKLDLIRRALALRARRPEAFSGAYEPLRAGPDAVAFVRGGEVLAAALLRGEPVELQLPAGEWRDVLAEREVSGTLTLDGIALLTRP